ncbi:MAG: STAS/SEC14 domain-containing protein [Balneolales bacterium]
MFKVEKLSDFVFEIYISGKIRKEDYDFVPELERKIEKHGKVNLYCEIESIEGVEPSAIWEDLKLRAKHFNSFEKVAIVVEGQWIQNMSQMAKPFTKAYVKVFKPEEKEEAKNWVMHT